MNQFETWALKHAFGTHYQDAIKKEVTALVSGAIATKGNATLTEVETAVDAALPGILTKVFAAGPVFLLPALPWLSGFATSQVNHMLEEIYNDAVSKVSQTVAKAA